MTCPRCNTVKAKRDCPALGAVICPKCCAAGREGEIECPLSCEYLLAAHQFERKISDLVKTPSQDIITTNEFLRSNEYLLVMIGVATLHALYLQPAADDSDILRVLGYLVSVWRGLAPGCRKLEPVVVDRATMIIVDRVRDEIIAARQQAVKAGVTPFGDGEVLGCLAWLQRTCYGMANGRPKCRAFMGFLQRACPFEKVKEDRPLVTLA